MLLSSKNPSGFSWTFRAAADPETGDRIVPFPLRGHMSIARARREIAMIAAASFPARARAPSRRQEPEAGHPRDAEPAGRKLPGRSAGRLKFNFRKSI